MNTLAVTGSLTVRVTREGYKRPNHSHIRNFYHGFCNECVLGHFIILVTCGLFEQEEIKENIRIAQYCHTWWQSRKEAIHEAQQEENGWLTRTIKRAEEDNKDMKVEEGKSKGKPTIEWH